MRSGRSRKTLIVCLRCMPASPENARLSQTKVRLPATSPAERDRS